MGAIDPKSLPPGTEPSGDKNPRVNLLDRAREAVREGRKPHEFSPIPIKGEPLSVTILRDRGPY